MSKILVTGGCGYIGSHTVVSLLQAGHRVISIDNFINSYEGAVEGIENITGKTMVNYPIDLCNQKEVARVFEEHPDLDGIIHFAALKAVGESVEKPILYFRNNLNSLINICEEALKHRISNFIFSSSCTVYGQASDLPVTEETTFAEPASPYGRTKQISEGILTDLHKSAPVKVISLRYFNPAGAHPSGLIGESSRVKAQNLVPVITETASGKREKCIVYGTDYPTRDGSCIRDYIHVTDLARAHTLALDYLLNKKRESLFEGFNLGIGQGVSVLEVIKAFEEVSGVQLNYELGPRRAGDIISIYSDYKKARKHLNWTPEYSINDIMETAWKWEINRPY